MGGTFKEGRVVYMRVDQTPLVEDFIRRGPAQSHSKADPHFIFRPKFPEVFFQHVASLFHVLSDISHDTRL